MKRIFQLVKMRIHAWLTKLLIKQVDFSESNEIIKVVSKKVGLKWVDMDNHIQITNKFIVPYILEEVKLTYYNDAGQNIGYLHFNTPTKIEGKSQKMVVMPAKMSNITALFNMLRMMLTDDIKTRAVGKTVIRLFGMRFELPMDDIMQIDKEKVVMSDETEEQKAARLAAKAERAAKREEERLAKKAALSTKRKEKRAEVKAKIKERKERTANKMEARKRLNRMKKNKAKNNQAETKKPQDEIPTAE